MKQSWFGGQEAGAEALVVQQCLGLCFPLPSCPSCQELQKTGRAASGVLLGAGVPAQTPRVHTPWALHAEQTRHQSATGKQQPPLAGSLGILKKPMEKWLGQNCSFSFLFPFFLSFFNGTSLQGSIKHPALLITFLVLFREEVGDGGGVRWAAKQQRFEAC